MHKKYCLVVTDDYSRFTWVFFLTTKDETSEILKNFIKEIENLVDLKVKIIRSDNGTEFKNKVMDDFCREKGIKREYSVARTPQQNSVAERRNRTLIEAARTMLADSKLPTTFWAEAVSTACYVQNRVLVVKPHNKTPYELFRGFKPALSFMRPFGCHVTILNTLDSLGKFDGKSDEGFFVGYSLSSKAFRVYNTRTRRVEENLHIGFLENKPMIEGNGPKWLFDIDSLTQSMNYVSVTAGTMSTNSVGTSEENSQDCIVMPIWKDTSYFDSPTKDVDNGEPKTADDPQKQVEDINTVSPDVTTGSLKLNAVGPLVNTTSTNEQESTEEEPEVDLGNITNSHIVPTTPNTRIHKDHPIDNVIGEVQSIIEPTSIAKALSDSSWVEAMQEELLQFQLQQEQSKAIRLLLAYASFMGFLVYQMDVKRAFLYGTIKEEVYVTQPPGFKDPDHPDKVYKVVKALYGLHQAPRAWYETLANYLLSNGFKRGKIDQTLFIKKQKGDILLVQVYVDDIIFGSTNKELCTRFEKLMKDKFQMSSMGELTFFLGLQVQQKEDGIFISQDKYVAEILKKFNYSDVKSASTPVDLEKPLVKDGDADDVDVHLYRSMIGSLMYLTASRPDIMFAVCACARFQVTPKTSHLLAVKRIFRYLKGKPTLGLWYSRDSPFELVAYTDSDYAGATQYKKSTTGGFAVDKYSGFKTPIAVDYDLLTKGFDAGRFQYLVSIKYGWKDMLYQKYVQKNQKDLGISKEVGTPRYFSLVVPQKKVGDEAVHKELGDRIEMAATTASSLEAEQDNGLPILGACDVCSKLVLITSKQSNDPPLSRGYTLGSGEDRMKQLKLMELFNVVRHMLMLSVQVPAAEESDGFAEIIDFLKASSVHYALTVNPIIYTSYIEQFWATANVQTVNGVRQLQALVDKKRIIVTESSIRRDLHLDVQMKVRLYFQTVTILEDTGRMGVYICLRTFVNVMVKSLDGGVNFFMYPTPGSNGFIIIQFVEYIMATLYKLQNTCSDLEKAKDAQAKEITALKKRVQKLERKKTSRTTGLKRLKKVGLSRRVESSEDQESLGAPEDASKQGRSIADIDANVEVTLVDKTQDRHDDELMFDTGVLDTDDMPVEAKVDEKDEQSTKLDDSTVGEAVTTASVEDSAAPTTIEDSAAPTTIEEITFGSDTYLDLLQEPSKFRVSQEAQPSISPKDKGKGIMIETGVLLKRKDQISLDEQITRDIQAKLDAELIEEQKLVRKQEEEANIALIESWENTQAMMEADRLLAERLQSKERDELTDEEKGKLFMELIEKRRKHFDALRAQEKRNIPPIKAQKRT
ncbi:putative ribonuclease H-like domain-containing protein [Tanacetum coccineum]